MGAALIITITMLRPVQAHQVQCIFVAAIVCGSLAFAVVRLKELAGDYVRFPFTTAVAVVDIKYIHWFIFVVLVRMHDKSWRNIHS